MVFVGGGCTDFAHLHHNAFTLVLGLNADLAIVVMCPVDGIYGRVFANYHCAVHENELVAPLACVARLACCRSLIWPNACARFVFWARISTCHILDTVLSVSS